MRILHVVPTYLPAVRYGGPIYSVHGLARALVERGHDVSVFTTNVDGAGVSEAPLDCASNINGVMVRYFPVSWPRRIYRAPALGNALRESLSDFSIVHLHSVFLWPTWAGALAARRAKIPYVLSPRGMLIRDLISRRSRIAKSLWITLFERSNIENAAAIHLTSQLEAAELKRFGWRLPSLAVIPNGLDKPDITIGETAADVKRIAADQPFVLFFGRISWKKGLDRLLHAFARTRAGKLAIVGTDDECLAPKLTMLARDLGILGRVHILPRTIFGTEKECLFAAARAVVLPSYSENFGNVVLEAMGRGVPVVVTQEVGASEVVRDSGGGLIAEGDPAELGASMSRFIEDPIFARSAGEAGRRHVVANYSWGTVAGRMEELYGSLQRIPSANAR